ncbi:dATP/dGTP pyrophosphohydrolase domain-containing protein [Citrobacter farmeri]|uniref:dATP/dGTP pyrophosphohydrolase domain-containing protein n=1 Tax=Citrobacter farmeri TaxID=67824 RepID=UPI0030B83F85
MTTITRFTKEQLIASAREKVKSLEFAVTQTAFAENRAELEEELELSRIALASLEAEPVAYWRHAFRADGFCYADGINSKKYHDAIPLSQLSDGDYWQVTPLYAAPPAPVVPDAYVRDERGRMMLNGVCEPRIGFGAGWNACRAAMLQGQPVSNRDELREQVRREHAEWSQATFGDVGPVGPLKHLSKEALEAAANPEDSLEWADMQLLLWDAQRRMGLSDDFITRAMIEKLAINKTRQWPEPKDGEPRLHIKEAGNSPVIPDRWIPVSERVPEKADEVLCAKEFDGPGDWRQKVGYYLAGKWTVYSASWTPTHWMPLPAAPQQEVK